MSTSVLGILSWFFMFFIFVSNELNSLFSCSTVVLWKIKTSIFVHLNYFYCLLYSYCTMQSVCAKNLSVIYIKKSFFVSWISSKYARSSFSEIKALLTITIFTIFGHFKFSYLVAASRAFISFVKHSKSFRFFSTCCRKIKKYKFSNKSNHYLFYKYCAIAKHNHYEVSQKFT